MDIIGKTYYFSRLSSVSQIFVKAPGQAEARYLRSLALTRPRRSEPGPSMARPQAPHHSPAGSPSAPPSKRQHPAAGAGATAPGRRLFQPSGGTNKFASKEIKARGGAGEVSVWFAKS